MPTYFKPELRRRLAPLMLVLGLLVMGKLAHEEVPRDQDVELLLSKPQQDASSVRIAYAHDGEDVSYVELRYEGGAPARVRHRPSLRPGLYDVQIDLGYRDGRVEHVKRDFSVPTEGAVRLRLENAR